MSWWQWLIAALVFAFAYFTLAAGIGRLLRDEKANHREQVQRLEATRDEIRGLNPDIASIMANMSEAEQRALADQVFDIRQRRNAR